MTARDHAHGDGGSTEERDLEHLRFFVRESNRIEGLTRSPTKRELQAHDRLLDLDALTVAGVQTFVEAVAPGKALRVHWEMNVRVGSHIAPQGGPHIRQDLLHILHRANDGENPWSVHVAYETLHPFMDGNGRSGRAIWLWQMIHQQEAPWALRMGFLHLFYYQTLSASGRVPADQHGDTEPTTSPPRYEPSVQPIREDKSTQPTDPRDDVTTGKED